MKSKLYSASEYKEIVKDLLNGNVVGFPTETVYGLAIVYNNKEAFDRLYEIKNRGINKPISMMVSSIDVLNQVADIDENSEKVIKHFMPGPLTIILNAKDNLPQHVTFNNKTIGVRIPDHEIALKILKEVGLPLLVTSANISNEPSLIKAKDVLEKFEGQISSLINEDAIDGIASSVVEVINEVKVYREGPISKKQLEEVIGG